MEKLSYSKLDLDILLIKTEQGFAASGNTEGIGFQKGEW